jgi:tetratricopeptide (TPR) repeat protein
VGSTLQPFTRASPKHEPARAVRELKVAVRLKPDNAMGYIALGEALGELEQNEAAVEEFKLALNADPKSVPAWTVWRKR